MPIIRVCWQKEVSTESSCFAILAPQHVSSFLMWLYVFSPFLYGVFFSYRLSVQFVFCISAFCLFYLINIYLPSLSLPFDSYGEFMRVR